MKKIIYALSLVISLIGCEAEEEGAMAPLPDQTVSETEFENDIEELKKVSVALLYKGKTFCSGTIVGSKMIITAYHCLKNIPLNKRQFVTIGFGEDMENPTHTREIIDFVEPKSMRKKLSSGAPFWDIAFVNLKKNIPKDYSVIPYISPERVDLKNSPVIMTGFGEQIQRGGLTGAFKFSLGQIIEDHQKGVFDGFFRVNFKERGTCRGDSGGGLFYKQDGKLVLVGTTVGSYPVINTKGLDNLDVIVGDKDVCELGDIIYTRLDTYRNWMFNHTDIAKQLSDRIPKDQAFPKNLFEACYESNLTLVEKDILFAMVDKYGRKICQKEKVIDVGSDGEVSLEINKTTVHGLRILKLLTFITKLKVLVGPPTSFPSLKNHSELTHLKIIDIKDVSLKPLLQAPQLKKVRIYKSILREDDINTLAELTSLEKLVLRRTNIGELPVLPIWSRLTQLDLAYNRIENLEFLRNAKKLESLNLVGNEITKISDLSFLTRLRTLYISGNGVRDISPLENLKELRAFTIFENPVDWSTCPVMMKKRSLCD